MCFKQGGVSTLSSRALKLVDKFMYLGSSVSSTESYVDICIAKVWTATDRLLIIRKSDLSEWMLQAILNKSWKQHPMKQQLYRHLSPISKIIQVRRTRHVGTLL